MPNITAREALSSPPSAPEPTAVPLPWTIASSRTLTRWCVAAALFGVALWARFALVGVLPPVGYPFLTFFPAVLLTAYCVGLFPGLAVSFASLAAAWFFFLDPPSTFKATVPDVIALTFFGSILLVDCAVIHLMRRAMQRSAAAQAELAAAVRQAQAQQHLLDATFNAVPASIIVAEPDGKLIRMNQATERVWGPAPMSVDVDGYAEWKGWWADGSQRHGQRLAPDDWGLARALQGETITQLVDVEPFGKPGVRISTLLSAAPVLDEHGRVAGGVVAQVDISERVRAEEALRDSEERFRTLADHIPQLAWMAGPGGDITWFNRRWFDFTGTTPHEMADGGWRTVHHPEHVDRVVTLFDERIASGTPWEDTFPLRAADGNYCWFLSRALPMKDAQGRVLRWFGTNTDVTAH
jgi:PAS domain S-box-containing protein